MSLRCVVLLSLVVAARALAATEHADLIVHHGKVVIVDRNFHVAQAMAIRADRVLAVGSNEEIEKLAGPATRQIDLQGKMVLPGLIDSHVHPGMASIYEFDHELPEMQTVADVLAHVRQRAAVLPPGQWICIDQVFITRLRDRRFPTRQELDEAAPNHPVCFRTHPDASLNSLALKLSGIDRNFQVTDGKPGFIQRDPATGEPTGIVRNCLRFVNRKDPGKVPTEQDRYDRLRQMLAAYNAAGITGITDREVHEDDIKLYQQLKDRGELTCRVFLTYFVDAQSPIEAVEGRIAEAERHPLHRYDNLLWLRGIKSYLDGGMLTGTAYMRQPWGTSKIYSISDPQYRGLLFIQPERLYQIARTALSHGFQFTAHSVGDGAVHALIDAYERVNREFPVRPLRPCICHSNFMSLEAIEKMQRLGIVADLQPAWLYLDGATLLAHFGPERLEYFQPYRTIFEHGVTVGGGSDHMQKIDVRRALNPYDPLLGIWTVLARQPRWIDTPLHPEQCLTRRQAIELYTINNAYLVFQEKEKGSLEKGKLADFVVLDKDLLTCPVNEIRDAHVEQTFLAGKCVYQRQ